MPSPARSVAILIACADSKFAGIAEIELGVTFKLASCDAGIAIKASEKSKTGTGRETTNSPSFRNCFVPKAAECLHYPDRKVALVAKLWQRPLLLTEQLHQRCQVI